MQAEMLTEELYSVCRVQDSVTAAASDRNISAAVEPDIMLMHDLSHCVFTVLNFVSLFPLFVDALKLIMTFT